MFSKKKNTPIPPPASPSSYDQHHGVPPQPDPVANHVQNDTNTMPTNFVVAPGPPPTMGDKVNAAGGWIKDYGTALKHGS